MRELDESYFDLDLPYGVVALGRIDLALEWLEREALLAIRVCELGTPPQATTPPVRLRSRRHRAAAYLAGLKRNLDLLWVCTLVKDGERELVFGLVEFVPACRFRSSGAPAEASAVISYRRVAMVGVICSAIVVCTEPRMRYEYKRVELSVGHISDSSQAKYAATKDGCETNILEARDTRPVLIARRARSRAPKGVRRSGSSRCVSRMRSRTRPG